jgi:hypothetical protein
MTQVILTDSVVAPSSTTKDASEVERIRAVALLPPQHEHHDTKRTPRRRKPNRLTIRGDPA